ncbi:MAG: type II secretion system secretin GspD [Gammaproteobacteria bacterium]|jgi:general secretion pathway protein D|nr:type II secretion system secretin GspD [Gammaproteobacteria bacterium]MBP6052841.1 type II secretion system secretin GspD [Pseudomonadales bacterium]MBK6582346.1 type II secretion system secretin GspD [Gammaproteobacteria bacterium]MBK7521382.1 type II secretion system secretin GspD [Gammaproteobacteria bacterium]MBK7729161.1 type II secretion system secretin GspD [Gammaproteobacteria bacterium]
MKIAVSRFRVAASTRQLLATAALLLGIAWQPGGFTADDKLVMNMRDADIRSLIQWVADITGKNLVVHKDVQGKVTVLSAEPLTPAEAYQVFLATLEVHGFAAIDADGAVKIVPQSMASASSPPLGRSGGGETVVSIIRAHNVPVAQLANNLRPLVPASGMLTAYPETNSLIISSSAHNVQRINDIVHTLDQGAKLQFETIRLEHANAQDVEKSLAQLIPGLAGSEGYRFVNISVDTRTNTILLGGEPENRRQVRNLIDSLDQEVMGGNTDVIYLQYVQADEMLAILKGIGDALQTGSGEQAAGGGESKISIEASKSTNALVVNAPPAIVSKMRSIVEQVDIRRAQVMIEALVVEVTDDDVRDLGVSWIYSGGDHFGDDGTNVAVNTLGPNLKLGDVVDSDGRIIRAGGGLTLGYFDNGDLKAAIRALATSTKANILSTPTIVALDNEEAELLVGQNVPFKTGESTGSASSTENPFTTIERQDIGTSLTIKAQINRGDSITLDLKQSTESIAPSVDVASDIVTNKRLIKTKALIKDGQTLVVGGLLRDDESEQRTKVPILGDIPLLGKLFGSTSKSHGKTNLMVFIHPTILKDDLQVAEITRQRYDFMRGQQASARKPTMPFEKTEPPSLPDFETITPRQ